VIQAGGETLESEIHKLINSIWGKEELPYQWKESITSPYIDEIIGNHQCTAVTNSYLILEEVKADYIQVMLATIQLRTFCHFICCLKM
jgi:hypothetical protein